MSGRPLRMVLPVDLLVEAARIAELAGGVVGLTPGGTAVVLEVPGGKEADLLRAEFCSDDREAD